MKEGSSSQDLRLTRQTLERSIDPYFGISSIALDKIIEQGLSIIAFVKRSRSSDSLMRTPELMNITCEQLDARAYLTPMFIASYNPLSRPAIITESGLPCPILVPKTDSVARLR